MDILKDLLTAYLASIPTQRAAGKLLYLRSWYVIQSPESVPPDMSTETPCLLIWPGVVNAEIDCLPALSDEKTYNINLTVLREGYDDETLGMFGNSYTVGILDMAAELETIYRRETFGLSETVRCARIDYTQRRIPPFLGKGINQAHLTFEHKHMDMRATW